MKTLNIIVPCYNEEKALPFFFEEVDKVIPEIEGYEVSFILVNDGSKDRTLEVMEELYQKRDDITYINLSRNFGQNPAFSAGLKNCKADYCIMMDADLQDPLTLIKEICAKFDEGYDVVSPHRVDRKTDTVGKRTSAGMFYKFVNAIEGRKVIPENVNCFRGLSRKAIDHIKELPESDRYLVSEVPFVGFKTFYLDFTRGERVAGKTKYNYPRMINYALEIISSTTAKPLYTVLLWGVGLCLLNGFMFVVALILYILGATGVLYPHGVYSVLLIIFTVFLAMSVVVAAIGVVGLYIHNILINTRGRPNFIVDTIKRKEDKENV